MNESPAPEITTVAKPGMTGAEIVATLSFVIIIAGSILPWARSSAFDYPGISGEGLYTLVLGVVGLCILLFGRGRGISWLPLLAAVVVGIIALNASSDIQAFADRAGLGLRDPDPETAPGLIITLVGSLIGALAILVSLNASATTPPESE